MNPYTVLEIRLSRNDATSYGVCLVFHRGDSDTEVRLTRGQALFKVDYAELDLVRHDAEAYAEALTHFFFEDPRVRSGFAAGRAKAWALELPLHVRLHIEPEVAELHSLFWETLWDPEDEKPLFRGERVSFSRYLSGFDWRPVTPKDERDYRALVLVASPSNLAEYGLEPLDLAAERVRAEKGFEGIQTRMLLSGGTARLDNLITELREGYEILYLVSHGLVKRGESWLWLEAADGRTARVNGSDLVACFSELQHIPRLVILISCESAGSDARSDFFSALGPRLAEAGVPAVLAMQGKVSFQTMARFLPVFFHELRREGHLGRAMAIARGHVRDRADWWMPVLFTRLKSGRLWGPGALTQPVAVETTALHGQGLDRIQTPEPAPPVVAPAVLEPAAPSLVEAETPRRAPINDLVNPILGSVISVFQKFLNINVIRKSASLQTLSDSVYDMTAEVTFRGERFEGSLFLCFREGTLFPLFEKVLGVRLTEITRDAKDMVGEIANMIIGNAKANLPPTHHFKLSTPTFINAREHTVSAFSRYTMLRISFDSVIGPFDVNLYVDGIQQRLDRDPAPPTPFVFEPQLVEPILSSCERLFRDFLGLEVRRRGINKKEVMAPKFELSALLNVFTTQVRGKILLNLSKSLALEVHRRLLGETLLTIDDSVQDTVCELVNIITGNAKAEYAKHGLTYKLSVPYAINGSNQVISSSGKNPFLTTMYWTNLGMFELCANFQSSAE